MIGSACHLQDKFRLFSSPIFLTLEPSGILDTSDHLQLRFKPERQESVLPSFCGPLRIAQQLRPMVKTGCNGKAIRSWSPNPGVDRRAKSPKSGIPK